MTWITEKELEREIRTKGDQFRWNKNIKTFQWRLEKGEMLAATKVKMSGSDKKKKSEQEHIRHFLHKKWR